MTVKHELILDVAGVLATNFSPFFWQELSIESATPYDLLSNFQKENSGRVMVRKGFRR
jgi:putative hydrolase of the HAD superfamily